MRQSITTMLFVCLLSGLSSLSAQGPFGRGLGFGPGMAMRPPMPVPGVFRPGPSYLRVPGVAISPIGPANIYRPRTVVAVPIAPPPIAVARVAVVQPSTGTRGSQSARSSYQVPPTAPLSGSTAGDLRPGTVLPDGAIVVSIGQSTAPTGPNPTGQAESTSVPQPATAPMPAPTAPEQSPSQAAASGSAEGNSVPNTQSILEKEEIPRPSDLPPATKQF